MQNIAPPMRHIGLVAQPAYRTAAFVPSATGVLSTPTAGVPLLRRQTPSSSASSAVQSDPTASDGSASASASASGSTGSASSVSSGSDSGTASNSASGSSSSSSTSSSTTSSTSSFTSSTTTTSSSTSTTTSSTTSTSTSTTTSSSTTSTTTSSSTSSTTSLTTSSSTSITTDSTSTTTTPSTTVSGKTTITSSFVTTVDGKATTISSLIPTTLPDSPSSSSSSHTRTVGIAVGAAVGIVLLVTLLLAALFRHRRGKLKQLWFLDRLKRHRRRRELLAGEDFDDDDLDLQPGSRYHDYPPSRGVATPSHMHTPSESTASFRGPAMRIPDSPPYASYADPFRASLPHTPNLADTNPSYEPRLFRPRASESGSIFRESVWPPPADSSRLVDPLLEGPSQVRFSGIIEDVMGPPKANDDGHKEASQSSFADHNRSNSSLLSSDTPSTPPHNRSDSMTALFSALSQEPPALSSMDVTTGTARSGVPNTTPVHSSPLAERTHTRTPSNEARPQWLDRHPRHSMEHEGPVPTPHF
ncbi:hypothetical protein PUNSTDRAFT_140964 [Punctularia strigosozonata HHB-11173 SS5]|uniref:uncharacterized protein n=1 Tax=Punctularia strigosozonata (strain HHB-11173) TaxID=741275 RepID=UPI00044167AA|nr:uncharacterized protein PUNSTDRAFT_140964 [Punctularia strigosozonata HHB-11173 SS5]EIN14746.1 hypothetical protein PUNSTDRAFT_140964 [Punctularia strigosozonata HHB-11173 SS5]